MTKLKLDLAMQICMAVHDVDESLAGFRALFDVPEETIHFSNSLEAIRRGDLTPQSYFGVEGEYGYRQVNFHCAGLDIEMFQPLDPEEEGNPVADFLRQNGGPGIHHVSIRLANRAEGLAYMQQEMGIPCMWEGLCFNRHYAYYDLRELLGITLEVGSRVVGPRALLSPEELEKLLH